MDTYTRAVINGKERSYDLEEGAKEKVMFNLIEKNRRLLRKLIQLRKMQQFLVKPPETEEDWKVWQSLKELHEKKLISLAERRDTKGGVKGYEIYVLID